MVAQKPAGNVSPLSSAGQARELVSAASALVTITVQMTANRFLDELDKRIWLSRDRGCEDKERLM